LHVPLIIHLPAASSSTKTKAVSDLVNLADVMPTVLEALHIRIPTQVQGHSLLPLMDGAPRELSQYAETFLPRLHFNWSELRGIETNKYHYIDAPKPELYDLGSDPGERNNLVSQKPAVAQELSRQLSKLIVDYSAGHELAAKTGLDPALMERLKSLGYAGFSGGGSTSTNSHSLPDPKDRVQIYELFSDAVAESQHGQYADSSAKLDEVLKVEPDSIPAHYIIGLNYYRMKQFPDAIAHLEKVLQLSPDYALAAYNLGLAYGRSGDLDNAIRTLKRTLELDSTNFDAAYNLGTAYFRKNMVQEAVTAFHQAENVAPDYPLPHKALGEVLLYQGQTDEAIPELKKAAELLPRDASIHVALAKAFAAKGMDQESQEEMRRAQQVQSQ